MGVILDSGAPTSSGTARLNFAGLPAATLNYFLDEPGELRRSQTQRQAIRRDSQAGMHQQPADHMLLMAPVLQLMPGRDLGEADLLRMRAFERELGRVLQDQDGTIRGLDALRRSRKVTFQDLVFADAPVREKAVSRLGVRPILERRWQRFARSLANSF